MDTESRLEILTEDMNSKFDAIMEYVRDIPEINTRLTTVEDKVDVLQSDMTVVKSVLKDHSATLNEHTQELKEIKAIVRNHGRDVDDLKSRQLRVEAQLA